MAARITCYSKITSIIEVKQLAHDAHRNEEVIAVLPFAPKIIKLEVDRRAMAPVDPEGSSVMSNAQASPMAMAKPMSSKMMMRRLIQSGIPITANVPSMI